MVGVGLAEKRDINHFDRAHTFDNRNRFSRQIT